MLYFIGVQEQIQAECPRERPSEGGYGGGGQDQYRPPTAQTIQEAGQGRVYSFLRPLLLFLQCTLSGFV